MQRFIINIQALPLRCVSAFLFVLAIASPSSARVEKSLLGIALGDSYAETKKALTKKYGKPDEGSKPGYDVFFLSPVSRKSHVIIFRGDGDTDGLVEAIQVNSTLPLEDLDFTGGLNFGMSINEFAGIFGEVTKRDSADGFILYEFPNQNFTVETKDEKVESIRIAMDFSRGTFLRDKSGKAFYLSHSQFHTLGDVLEGLSKKEFLKEVEVRSKDHLRKYCAYRFPFWFNIQGDVPIVQATVSSGKKSIGARFLLDSGWAKDPLISEDLCKRWGCEKTKSRNHSGFSKVAGGTIKLGKLGEVKADFFDVGRVAGGKELGYDGILGGDYFTRQEIVINFGDEYICVPKKPLNTWAVKSPWTTVPFQLVDFQIIVELTANKQKLKGYLLDTGASNTRLFEKHIKQLKLKKVGTMEGETVNGKYVVNTFGPVTFEFGPLKLMKNEVKDNPDNDPLGYALLGNDLLQHLKVGISPHQKLLYLAP